MCSGPSSAAARPGEASDVGKRRRWGRGGCSREARAVVGDGDVHAGLELALQLVDALTKTRNHRRPVGRCVEHVVLGRGERLQVADAHADVVLLGITASGMSRHWRNVNSIAGVHDRRDLGNHDAAIEVEAGGLDHPLSTQVVGDDAESAAPLLEEAGSLLIPSLPLPHLLAFFLTAKSSPARGLYGLTNFRTPRNRRKRQTNFRKRKPRNRRQRPTIWKIMRKPEGTNSRGLDRACRSG